jgi:hypothetical protein
MIAGPFVISFVRRRLRHADYCRSRGSDLELLGSIDEIYAILRLRNASIPFAKREDRRPSRATHSHRIWMCYAKGVDQASLLRQSRSGPAEAGNTAIRFTQSFNVVEMGRCIRIPGE